MTPTNPYGQQPQSPDPQQPGATGPQQPGSPETPYAQTTPPKKNTAAIMVGCGCGILLLLAIAGAGAAFFLLGNSDDSDEAPSSTTSVVEQTHQPDKTDSSTPGTNVAPNKEQPAKEATTPSAEKQATPATNAELTPEKERAVKAAQRYLRLGGFSHAKLFEQLTSEHGEGLPVDAAEYAIDQVDADWNEQALIAAQKYKKIDMSDSDIYRKLVGDKFGDGFTPEEAQYAIDHLAD